MEENIDADTRTFLWRLLEQQLGVIARIDTNSNLGLQPNGFWFGPHKKKREQRQQAALTMAKQMSGACRQLLLWLSSDEFEMPPEVRAKMSAQWRGQAIKDLDTILSTNFDHPYEVGAKWNLHDMRELLVNGSASLGQPEYEK